MTMEKLTPAEFESFLGGTRLAGIWIKSAECRLSDSELAMNAAQEVGLEIGFASELDSSSETRTEISVLVGVRLVSDVPGSEGEEIGLIAVTYRIVYDTESKMTDRIFEQFSKLTLRLHVVPFARAWIHEQSIRMGIQPVLLPLEICHPAALPKKKGTPAKPEVKLAGAKKQPPRKSMDRVKQ